LGLFGDCSSLGRAGPGSESFALALSKIERIGGLPREERMVDYESAAAVTKLCRSAHIAIVYVTPRFDGEVEALREVLPGTSVLTVSPIEEYVKRGVVLGFELVSGRPKLVCRRPGGSPSISVPTY
jgi:hypothetical protein